MLSAKKKQSSSLPGRYTLERFSAAAAQYMLFSQIRREKVLNRIISEDLASCSIVIPRIMRRVESIPRFSTAASIDIERFLSVSLPTDPAATTLSAISGSFLITPISLSSVQSVLLAISLSVVATLKCDGKLRVSIGFDLSS